MFPWLFVAFITHAFGSFLLSSTNGVFGICWTALRKSRVSLNGMEYDRDESCEMGCKGFEVVGKVWAEVSLGRGTSSVRGAVLGYTLDKEFGKMSVTTARCCICCWTR